MFQVTEFNKPIIFEVNMDQKVIIGHISKIVNFHLIDLKFEKDLYITLLNSNGQLFLLVNIHQKVNN